VTRSTRNILIGLGLGIATGLFLGDRAGFLKFVAEAYVRLLQMTVLPYLIVSVVRGLAAWTLRKPASSFLE